MNEIKGDLWELPTDAICITTNGYVRKDGKAVMGRGCALEAKELVPGIDRILGRSIMQLGNHVYPLIDYKGRMIYSFPVKHKWWESADMELIKRSCIELNHLIPFRKVLLPRPGCGNGKLSWTDVKPLISRWLGDNVWVVHK